ncbi:MAG: hypothetical protein MZW92_00610 [Comamonadaceae bacterium]|nr:hypothetical protein [Comamonadaceae bacterium]
MTTALLRCSTDFALEVLLGAAIRRWMHLGDHFWAGVEKLVYFILFPALLINAIVKTPRSIWTPRCRCSPRPSPRWPAGWLLALLARPVCSDCRRCASPRMFQCAYRFNSYIALAVAGMLFGAPGIATMGPDRRRAGALRQSGLGLDAWPATARSASGAR